MGDIELGIDTAARPLARRAELTEEAKEEIREAFELFDSSNIGFVERRELKVMMRALGFEPRKEQLSRMLLRSGISPRQNQIKFEEFVTLMSLMMNERNIQEEMMKAFSLFDVDKTGKISLANLRTVADQLGEKMTDSELEEMIREADLDKDGFVSATEFVRIMKKTDLW
eukprot:GFKZ01015599.1.p2 GENE.GFKZ01015599.1~~GFKZ01015599.1.p2  ORF type:complete len:170 (+),score=48.80 GFKZ01015599.1:1293-1802(+)